MAVLRPRRPRIASAAGAADVTGTGAGTLRTTLAASGTVRLAGTGAGTLRTTLAASGQIRLAGIGAGTLRTRLAATGVIGELGTITGTLAATLRIRLVAAGTADQEKPLRTAILDAIVTALTDAAITIRGDAVTIARSRTDSIEENERPLLAVVGGDMDQTSAGYSYTLYRLRVTLAGYLGGASEQLAEEDAALLHAYAIRALIRPDPLDAPVALLLADGSTEVWIEEVGLRVEPASVVQSETPAATCIIELTAEAQAAWGNPFVTA